MFHLVFYYHGQEYKNRSKDRVVPRKNEKKRKNKQTEE